MQKYKQLHRTTMDQFRDGIPYTGIYIIAYLGKVMYVGKAAESVFARLKSHMYYRPDRIGRWLVDMEFDWRNIRLDILEPPDEQNNYWLFQAEDKLIKRFHPLFNDKLQV